MTNADDPGDGTCNTGCTLREAISEANANPGADDIAFEIPGRGVHTITLIADLPLIIGPVTIDGYTQTGASANTLAVGNDAVLQIEVNGANAFGGFLVAANDCTIRGLVINRCDGDGILIAGLFGAIVSNTLIEGNFIGTDPGGTIARGNGSAGVVIRGGTNNVIGGLTPAARNLISDNFYWGVRLEDSASENVIQGNYIGTDASGRWALGNLRGVSVGNLDYPNFYDNEQNVVGGTTAGAGNVISGNGDYGISIQSSDKTQVLGNKIGTDASGTLPLPNDNGGIYVLDYVSNTLIGGTSGAGNVIAFNLGPGVLSTSGSSTGNRIFGNAIFSNSGLGINLVGGDDANDVTANDLGDTDVGPNNLQNYPVINEIAVSGADRTVEGQLNSMANTDYTIDFYQNSEVDPSGFGEGESYLGSLEVHTDAIGNVSCSFPLDGSALGHFITATATDPDGNTSEFSKASAIVPPFSRFLNISTRLRVQTGDNVLIGGLIINGTDPKEVIVRAIGRSLGNAGVIGALADPVLELHYPDGTTVVTNNNWRDDQETEIMATGLAPTDDVESAIVATLEPGLYTAIVRGVNGGTGVGLVEAYDLDQAADSELANISTRGLVETGDNVMIGGIIVGPEEAATGSILLRGIGPSLSDFGIANPLADPMLELRDGHGALVMANDNWKSTQQAVIEATGLQPTDDNEPAILAALAPGIYTAIMSGAGDTTGIGLVEAYHVD